MLAKLDLHTASNETILIQFLLLEYTVTRLLKIRSDAFIWRMEVGRGKEVKIVKYAHNEEAIPAGKLRKKFSFETQLPIYLQESLRVSVSCHGNMDIDQINKPRPLTEILFEWTCSLLPSLVLSQAPGMQCKGNPQVTKRGVGTTDLYVKSSHSTEQGNWHRAYREHWAAVCTVMAGK